MKAPDPIETLADLERGLGALRDGWTLPRSAGLEVILATASGEESRPEWNLAGEIHHLLDASLVRCCLDPAQGDDELAEPTRQRLEAAWRTARLVGLKVRSLEALHTMRLRELSAELEAARNVVAEWGTMREDDKRAIEDVCPLLRQVAETSESYSRDLGQPQWEPMARLARLMHDAARSKEPAEDVAARLCGAIAALVPERNARSIQP